MSNRTHYGNAGIWKQPVSAHVGNGGTWNTVRARLIGKDGRWTEVYDSETQADNAHQLTAIGKRSGTPYQSGVTLTGVGLDRNTIAPYPLTGAFYPATANLTEYSANFGPLTASGGAATVGTNGGGYNLVRASSQYLTMPTFGTAGFMQSALLGGGTGNSFFLFACKVYAATLQDNTFLLHSGTGKNRVYLKLDSAGTLTFGWEGGGVTMPVVTLASAVTAGVVTGLYVTHTNTGATTGSITITTHTGATVTASRTIPYFRPSASVPVTIGKGVASFTASAGTAFFTTIAAHPQITVVSSTNITMTSTVAGASYRAIQPGETIQPGTGKYYIEILNKACYDLHFGVAEPGADVSFAPGIVGWCVNTINGRKFNHQTGGGTAWSSAIPANSNIGLLYDSTAGTLEIFVDGVARALPFAAGTIAVPVKFIIGGRANGTGVPLDLDVKPSSFTYPKSGAVAFPLAEVINETLSYGGCQIRHVAVRNVAMQTAAVLTSFINPAATFAVKWKNVSTLAVTDGSSYIEASLPTSLTTAVPNLAAGDYDVTVEVTGRTPSTAKRFTIRPFTYNATGIDIDFTTAKFDQISAAFMCAHKQWGGANGGVIKENISLLPAQGICRIAGLGDNYTGPLRGVNNLGDRTTQATRIGGVIVTKDYFGPGSYRVLAKLPPQTGMVSTIWTFHYEEVYDTSPLYSSVVADGLSPYAAGYVVRNHEIDIESPTALKTDPDQELAFYTNARFNTWRGEKGGEYTDDFNNHGVALNDGQYHELRFDWHLGASPRVEFYIDGVLKGTNTTDIPDIPGRFWVGLWFPSAPGNFWAGATAAFSELYMDVKRVQIIPFAESGVRSIGESFPDDRFYPMNPPV